MPGWKTLRPIVASAISMASAVIPGRSMRSSGVSKLFLEGPDTPPSLRRRAPPYLWIRRSFGLECVPASSAPLSIEGCGGQGTLITTLSVEMASRIDAKLELEDESDTVTAITSVFSDEISPRSASGALIPPRL